MKELWLTGTRNISAFLMVAAKNIPEIFWRIIGTSYLCKRIKNVTITSLNNKMTWM